MRSVFTIFGTMFAAIVILGYLAFDYHIANKRAEARGDGPISFGQYTSGLIEMVGLATDGDDKAAGAEAVPEALIAMLPKAPEGWTMRPAEPTDVDPFLPKGAQGEDAERVRGVVNPRPGEGTIWAKYTYTQGAKKVIFELIRYPDFIFTSYMAVGDRERLRGLSAGRFADAFATIRGMEVHEGKLPKTYGARYFIGHVGEQIHMRVLASRGMTDQELVPFFATLNVPAMNADVVEPTPGLGEVPVIVLASVLTEETRRAREAERAAADAARKAEADARRAEQEAARAAEAAAAEAAEEGKSTDEESGVTIRKGTGEGKDSTFEGSGALQDEACRTEGGRKICGAVVAPEEN